MKLLVKKGATSVLVGIVIQNSSSTTGAGLTGLTSGSSGLVCYRARSDDGNAGGTQITLSGGTRGTWSSGGFVEKDSTNMPGVYELGIPDAALATGSNYVIIMLKGATNMAPLALEIELVAFDPQDTVRLGLTALPNVASGSAGAIPTTGTGSNQISVASGQVIIQAGTGAGQLDFTSGVVKANATQLLGTAWLTPGTAGTPDVNVKLWNGLTTVALPLVPTTAGRTLDVSATGEAGVDWANVGSPTTAVALTNTSIASVSGAVGSVTGAVGSVTAGVTVTTNNDKTGYSLTQAFPTNFSALGISVTGHISNVDTLTTYTGDTPQTGDSFARLGAPVGASISADIAGVPVASLDVANGIETGVTPRQAYRIMLSTTGGKLSGAGSGSETFRNAVADTKNRVVATVDASGNRTAITYDTT